MATLRDIRRQLHSVKNIEKITQAMEMVAASRLRRAQNKAEASIPYYLKLKEILDNLLGGSEDLTHPLITPRKVKKTAVIVVAGDRGLCGSYNQAVFNAADKFLQKFNLNEVEVIPVGRKAVNHYAAGKYQTAHAIPVWGGKITHEEIHAFTHAIIERYLKEELDEVWVIYTHFVSLAKRSIVIDKFLNIEFEKKEARPPNYILEPNAYDIFAEILPRYSSAKISSVLNEAYLSELAARIFSMRAATKNSEEMITSLTLVRNKIRQSSITRELIEITSGAESLK
jgi:F-type H+-transporting ATPase subunit gamma